MAVWLVFGVFAAGLIGGVLFVVACLIVGGWLAIRHLAKGF